MKQLEVTDVFAPEIYDLKFDSSEFTANTVFTWAAAYSIFAIPIDTSGERDSNPHALMGSRFL